MNIYEILLIIWSVILSIGILFIHFEILDRTKFLWDKIDNLEHYIDSIYYDQQKVTKIRIDEDENDQSVCYVFDLKKASGVFNEKIVVSTIDQLKDIWDKYGHSDHNSANKIFDANRLIIDFDQNRIIIYDNWVE